MTLGAVLVVGCGGGAQALGPAHATAALATALRERDVAELARATGRTEAEITASLEANRRELGALGETLARTPTDASARVALGDGGTLLLVREGESWRVDRGVLGRPALARPEDAVLALHDALTRSRIAAVLALLARTQRAELELELGRWIDGTADPEALDVSVQGESATVTTPTGERVDLVRESGEWRIVEIR